MTTQVNLKKKKSAYTYAVGRRKTAAARVRYHEQGEGKGVTVNGKPHDQYFAATVAHLITQPIELIAAPLSGFFTVRVLGGGPRSQAEAVRHGIARVLVALNAEWKPILKSKGYLTRDPRMKERKKPGLKRARRAPQWSKR